MTNTSNTKHKRFSRAIMAALLAVAAMTTLSACGGGKPTYDISGTITSGGSVLTGVVVTLTGNSSGATTTDANGNYTFSDLDQGKYTVTIDKNFLFRGGSIGWLFWLVNGYFASILHRKAGAGDAIW